MKEQELNYADALAELEKILESIESEELDVDLLLEKVKRAAILIEICKTKLKGVEHEVEGILSKMK